MPTTAPSLPWWGWLELPCLRVLVLATALLTACRVDAGDNAEVRYMIHCMGCHLQDGSGSPPAVPDIRGEMGRLMQVEGGRRYMVQVPGAAQAPVSDEVLARIVNYMALTFSPETLPENFTPYTAEEVAGWRPAWPTDVLAERAQLMQRLAAQDRAAQD